MCAQRGATKHTILHMQRPIHGIWLWIAKRTFWVPITVRVTLLSFPALHPRNRDAQRAQVFPVFEV